MSLEPGTGASLSSERLAYRACREGETPMRVRQLKGAGTALGDCELFLPSFCGPALITIGGSVTLAGRVR